MDNIQHIMAEITSNSIPADHPIDRQTDAPGPAPFSYVAYLTEFGNEETGGGEVDPFFEEPEEGGWAPGQIPSNRDWLDYAFGRCTTLRPTGPRRRGGAWVVRPRVQIYEHGMRISSYKIVDREPIQNGGKGSVRGDVVDFSKWSRRRLMQLMSRVNTTDYHPPTFVTLTYHLDWETRDWKRDLKIYLQRIRRAYPDAQYIWRMELQRRGAPHFHVLLFLPKTLNDLGDLEGVDRMWHDVVDPSPSVREAAAAAAAGDQPWEPDRDFRRYGARSERLESYEKLMYYVSKYVAKQTDPELEGIPNQALGRRWGRSRGLRDDAVLDLEVGREFEEETRARARDYLMATGHPGCGTYAETVVEGHTSFLYGDADNWTRIIDVAAALVEQRCGGLWEEIENLSGRNETISETGPREKK